MRQALGLTRLGTATILLVAAAALLALWAPRLGPAPASANHLVTLGLDMNPSATPANTPTSLGTIETCRDLPINQSLTFDVYITNIGTDNPSTASLLAFSVPVSYNAFVLKVTARDVVNQFLSGGANSNVTDASDPVLPDTDGLYEVGGADINNNIDDRGSGVLAKITVQALIPGVSTMSIAKVDLNADTVIDRGPFLQGDNVVPIGDTNGDTFFDGPANGATIAVGQPDSDGDGVSDVCDPDSDNDGIPNGSDNCPTVANPGQQNLDGDSLGDACDGDMDGDGFVNTRETATGSNPSNASSLVEVCDGVDNDGDTLIDEDAMDHDGDTQINDTGPDADGDTIKDCLDNNTDTDGDTVPNSSDTNDDDDGDADADYRDGSLDTRENWMGIDSLDFCPDNSSDQTWFADVDNNKQVNIGDVIGFRDPILTIYGDAKYNRRYDFNADRKVNIGDVIGFTGYILTTCTNKGPTN